MMTRRESLRTLSKWIALPLLALGVGSAAPVGDARACHGGDRRRNRGEGGNYGGDGRRRRRRRGSDEGDCGEAMSGCATQSNCADGTTVTFNPNGPAEQHYHVNGRHVRVLVEPAPGATAQPKAVEPLPPPVKDDRKKK